MINIVKFEVNDNIKAVNRAAALYLELSSIYSYEIDFIKKEYVKHLQKTYQSHQILIYVHLIKLNINSLKVMLKKKRYQFKILVV